MLILFRAWEWGVSEELDFSLAYPRKCTYITLHCEFSSRHSILSIWLNFLLLLFFFYFSVTWTASGLDRGIITVLTGQAVDLFDQLFQDLYMMSNAVTLNTINLEKEQKLEPILKSAPALQLSTTIALIITHQPQIHSGFWKCCCQ